MFRPDSEHHSLHVDRGSQVVRNLIHAAIGDGALPIPGAEDSVPRHGELLARVLRERLAALFSTSFL